MPLDMNKSTTIIIGLVLVAVSFYGGVKYGQSQIPVRGIGTFAGGQGGRGTRGGAGGFISGQVLSTDAQSITIQMRDGSTKIVLMSNTTTVMKSVEGSIKDVKIGAQIMTNGIANTDGSITAESISIRPATTTTPN